MATRCGACGKEYTADDDYPGLEERACDCSACPWCGDDFLPDDDNAPAIGTCDEEECLDGTCGYCMEAGRSMLTWPRATLDQKRRMEEAGLVRQVRRTWKLTPRGEHILARLKSAKR